MPALAAMMRAIGALFGLVDAVTVGAYRSLRAWLVGSASGPAQDLLFYVLLIGTGVIVLVEDAVRLLDRGIGLAERAFVSVAMLLMTLLAFNEYLAREFRPRVGDLGGLFALDGQMNMALLLMVVVGFLGASLATQTRQHLSVDAMERVLAAGAARFVRRLVSVVSAGLCFIFARGSWSGVFTHSQDAFEGAIVWPWLVTPLNVLTSWMPGEKYGPPSCKDVAIDAAARLAANCPVVDFATSDKWIDAKYDAGLDPMKLFSFGYLDAGDRFPLWVPLLLLVVAFGMMSLRFLATAYHPRIPDPPFPRPGTRRPADVVLAGALPGALITLGLGAWFGTGPLILIGSLLIVLLGSPLFVGVGVGTLACWVLLRNGNAETMVSDMFEATKKQELLSIPFFVLAGNLMTKGAIATRLIAVARAILGNVPGGLGVGAVAACAFFAAISGSSPVTVIAIGSIMFPMLQKDGYNERFSIGLLTTAGGLGIIIPPSIPMIVYAIMVSGNPAVGAIDPAVLFKAGIGPGLFIAATLAMYTLFLHWPRGTVAVSDRPLGPALGSWATELARATVRGSAALFLPVLILGGIYGWMDFGGFSIVFTVTEAAAVAVVYALVVELLVHRELKWRQVPEVFTDSAIQMGTLFLILVIAISLNRFFVFEQLPDRATAWVLSWVDTKLGFLIAVNLFLLGVGCVMDILSAILIVAPLLAPIAASYGIHPVHFGIMFIVNLEIGYLTPPMGINLFVASTVFRRSVVEVIRSVVPYLFLMFFTLIVIVAFPQLSLFLVGQ